MQDLKLYGLNIGAMLFSAVNDFNPILQTIVLVLTIIYTAVNIYKQFNKWIYQKTVLQENYVTT